MDTIINISMYDIYKALDSPELTKKRVDYKLKLFLPGVYFKDESFNKALSSMNNKYNHDYKNETFFDMMDYNMNEDNIGKLARGNRNNNNYGYPDVTHSLLNGLLYSETFEVRADAKTSSKSLLLGYADREFVSFEKNMKDKIEAIIVDKSASIRNDMLVKLSAALPEQSKEFPYMMKTYVNNLFSEAERDHTSRNEKLTDGVFLLVLAAIFNETHLKTLLKEFPEWIGGYKIASTASEPDNVPDEGTSQVSGNISTYDTDLTIPPVINEQSDNDIEEDSKSTDKIKDIINKVKRFIKVVDFTIKKNNHPVGFIGVIVAIICASLCCNPIFGSITGVDILDYMMFIAIFGGVSCVAFIISDFVAVCLLLLKDYLNDMSKEMDNHDKNWGTRIQDYSIEDYYEDEDDVTTEKSMKYHGKNGAIYINESADTVFDIAKAHFYDICDFLNASGAEDYINMLSCKYIIKLTVSPLDLGMGSVDEVNGFVYLCVNDNQSSIIEYIEKEYETILAGAFQLALEITHVAIIIKTESELLSDYSSIMLQNFDIID